MKFFEFSEMGFFGMCSLPILFCGILYLLFILGKIKPGCTRIFGQEDPKGLHTPNQNAIEILKIRYAKGEISKDSFETLKKELK